MKARTCLLLACMIIVPGLAMFSHHLPQDVRLAARSSLWEPVVAWLERKGSEPALVDPPEQASQIAVEGDVAETECCHDRESPVNPCNPGVRLPLDVVHDQAEAGGKERHGRNE